jgi:hypothetical protein
MTMTTVHVCEIAALGHDEAMDLAETGLLAHPRCLLTS